MANECEFTSYHVIKNRGEGKISYELKDLAPYALVDDVDVFVLGEINASAIHCTSGLNLFFQV